MKFHFFVTLDIPGDSLGIPDTKYSPEDEFVPPLMKTMTQALNSIICAGRQKWTVEAVRDSAVPKSLGTMLGLAFRAWLIKRGWVKGSII